MLLSIVIEDLSQLSNVCRELQHQGPSHTELSLVAGIIALAAWSLYLLSRKDRPNAQEYV
jgi:hypothetical protein